MKQEKSIISDIKKKGFICPIANVNVKTNNDADNLKHIIQRTYPDATFYQQSETNSKVVCFRSQELIKQQRLAKRVTKNYLKNKK